MSQSKSPIWKVDPATSFEERGHNGLIVRAERKDLTTGITVTVPMRYADPENKTNLAAMIAADVGLFFGMHGVHVWPNIPSGHGFSGYGHQKIIFVWENGEPFEVEAVKP